MATWARAVYNILKDRNARHKYDTQGRGPFEDSLPKPPNTHPPGTSPGAAATAYECYTESINMLFAKEVQDLLASRQIKFNGISLCMILEFFLQRAIVVNKMEGAECAFSSCTLGH